MIVVKTEMREIPDRCYDCDLYDKDKYLCMVKKIRTSDWRPYWCPMKEEKQT